MYTDVQGSVNIDPYPYKYHLMTCFIDIVHIVWVTVYPNILFVFREEIINLRVAQIQLDQLTRSL